jgi:hypothetical protein
LQRPGFFAWFLISFGDSKRVENLIEGLRKAGLEIPDQQQSLLAKPESETRLQANLRHTADSSLPYPSSV